MASPNHSDLKTSTGAEGHSAGGGFPPFNAETFAPQLFWLVLTFSALYLIMSRIALPRIGEVIEERHERIQRDLDNAERLKEETEEAMRAYDQALADARANASSIAAETRDKVTAEIDAERARVEEDIATKIADAETRISKTREEALSNVDTIASDIGVAMVYQLIGEEADQNEVREALSKASK
ncbi:MAG: F0F1 ATP synthase subunit B [Pseudomonadota bacterium]